LLVTNRTIQNVGTEENPLILSFGLSSEVSERPGSPPHW